MSCASLFAFTHNYMSRTPLNFILENKNQSQAQELFKWHYAQELDNEQNAHGNCIHGQLSKVQQGEDPVIKGL
eukprot:4603305-Amphidinium_carterae.1